MGKPDTDTHTGTNTGTNTGIETGTIIVTNTSTETDAEIWSSIKEQLKSTNSTNRPLQMWLDPTQFIDVDRSLNSPVLRLGVPTRLHKYWISQNLIEKIKIEVKRHYTEPVDVELVITGEHPLSSKQEFIGGDHEIVQPTAPKPQKAFWRESLNSDYTFATFVVGRNNEFAHAASFNIAENPGSESYNPLFICGPTGMGKTHLIHAVGNHVKEKLPDLRICYVSAERFLNECISSIRRNEMDKFRMRYRETSDVLLMDDIQVLGRGEAVQEEFFHTLNDFFDKGQQVIVASDRMPKDIHGLEDRIRTRLEWGLIADIQMPDIETRVAILKYKAEQRGLNVPQEVINYVARISKRSIRELEGNLNKVKMFSELQGLPISMESSRKVLSSHDDITTLSMNDIQKIVSEYFQVRIPDLKSKVRTRPLVTARQLAMFLAKKYLDKSLVEIGRSFGGKDHTTVINALRRMEDQLQSDLDLKRDFDEIERRIHNITGL